MSTPAPTKTVQQVEAELRAAFLRLNDLKAEYQALKENFTVVGEGLLYQNQIMAWVNTSGFLRFENVEIRSDEVPKLISYLQRWHSTGKFKQ